MQAASMRPALHGRAKIGICTASSKHPGIYGMDCTDCAIPSLTQANFSLPPPCSSQAQLLGPRLRSLLVQRRPGVGDELADALATKCPQLQQLNMSNTSVSAEVV